MHTHKGMYILSIKFFNVVQKRDFTTDEFALFLCSYGNL